MSQAGATQASERTGVAWKNVALFYAIALGFVSLLGWTFWLMHVDMTSGPPALVFQLAVGFLYMPMPLVAGLIVEKVARRKTLLRSTFTDFGRKWWRIGLFSALASAGVYLVNMGLVLVAGNWLRVPGIGHLVSTQQALIANITSFLGRPLPPSSLQGMPPVAALYGLGLVAGVVAGFSVNGLFAFGEEYGWRGVLMDELAPLGSVKANILTGVMWGFWHAPIILLGFNYGRDRLWGIVLMCVWLVPYSFLLWRSREYSGSVLAPAIIHGAFNGSAGFFLLMIESGNRLFTSPVGVLGAVSAAIVALIAWWMTEGRLYTPNPATVPVARESGSASA
jgi:membrane protease YdiL (CAAX protease family)